MNITTTELIDNLAILKNTKNIRNKKYTSVLLYLGTFNKYGGSCVIEKDIYYNIMDYVHKLSTKKYTYSGKRYIYKNMEMIIKSNNKYFHQNYPINITSINNMCFVLNDRTIITKNDFPIINKYDNIYYEKVKCYSIIENTNSININFIEEKNTLNGLNNPFFKINFDFKYDHINYAQPILIKLFEQVFLNNK
jgi:hypothetical protein